jgi:anaerobic magnesium-protoporphyrin IX monomethyl ester cyclase
MKIALINPPYNKLVFRCGYCSAFAKSNYYWPPIDLVVQSGFLSRAGYDIKVFDFNVRHTGRKKALDEIKSFTPEGIFILVGPGSWKSDISFIEDIKAFMPNIRVVASGAPLLYKPKEFLERFFAIDAVLMDFTQDVLGRMFEGKDNLPCISLRKGAEIKIGSPNTEKFFSYPPARHDLFPLNLYHNPHKHGIFTVLLTSFGCPYECTFCNTSGVPFKYRPVDEIIEELKVINANGIYEVKFRDLNFIGRRPRTQEICRKMIEAGIKAGWQATARADMIDELTLALMKKSGCHTLHIGVESGSEDLLIRYDKKVNLRRIEEAFRLCRKMGIRTVATFIIGLPSETEEMIQKTIDFSRKIKCDIASFNIATPLYGTKLHEECIEKGYIKSTGELEEFQTTSCDTVIETELLTREQIVNGYHRAMRSFYLRPGYILRHLRNIRNPREFISIVRLALPVLRNIFSRPQA